MLASRADAASDVVVASQGFFSGGNVSSSIDIWCNSSYREDQRCYVWNKETAGSTNLEAWCSSLNLIHEDCQCRTTYNQSDRELSAHCKVFDPVGFTNQCLETDARQALEGCRSKNAAHISEFRSLLYNKFPEGSLIQVQNLTSHECIEAYDRNFVDTRGPVVLITKDGTSSANDTFISMKTISGYRSSSTAQSWICEDDQTCGMSTAELTSDEWTVSNHTIDHCVSMEVPPRCRLQMSMHVLVAVIICNAIKFLVMISTLLFSEPTLVTMGDAIASFLNTPDPQSKNQEFIGRHDLLHSTAPALCFGMRAASPGRHPLSAKQRWSAAVTNDRWIVTLSLWLILLGTASGLLVRATQTIRQKSATNPFARGFGTLDTDATFNLQGQSTFEDTPPPEEIAAVIGTILLVNTPQIVATFLYFTYNAHLTAMVGSAEWSTFYLRHRPLRVSDPHGQQRSTYFLQLPFRYSLPLLFAGMALHWLISQSLFLARVNAVRYRVDGTFTESETMTQLGYSCTPLLLAVLLGGFLLLAIVGISFRTLPGHMPVVGSCSLAIAGACHRPKDDAGAALLPVAWGEVAEFEDEEGVASRCCFTSKEVVSPHGLPRQLNHKPRRHERFKRAKRGCSRESPLDTELTDLVHVS